MKKMTAFTLACGMSLIATCALAQKTDPSVAAYRAAIADKDGNPGLLIIDKGEALFKAASGPKNANLTKCDFGLGPGVIKGAYAQMPRYFADTNRVEDLETRLLHCMVTLQGKDAKEIKAKRFANETKNESNTDWEKIVSYIAYQSDGLPLVMRKSHPKEQEAIKVGETIFYKQVGPMDFSCATCHSNDDTRIRLQALFNGTDKKQASNVMSAWPTYRVSHNANRTMQHRMWDCHWQMRLPDIDMGSPATTALISYLTNQADGVKLDLPGMRR
ncbi:MAG TPA: sulfur oxidation c-type cytochrome SoxA [Burkholderiaceae bacterium]|nr:sulfur oxidation c-type cytochrome SoxA [Burkholderiaceae bacterium]